MTFIPLLGYYLLRPKAEPPIEQRRKFGFAAFYYRFGKFAIGHRWAFLAASVSLVAGGVLFAASLKQQFFPTDLQYLSYVDVWLPEDSPLSATAAAAEAVEVTIRDVATTYGKTHQGKDGRPRPVLRSLTTFVGGGGPRFWLSAAPEQSQLNYAQVLIEVDDKHDTRHLVEPLQEAISASWKRELRSASRWPCASWARMHARCAGWQGKRRTFSDRFRLPRECATTGGRRVSSCN
jgi:multidrug efflux pump subunit AcrB